MNKHIAKLIETLATPKRDRDGNDCYLRDGQRARALAVEINESVGRQIVTVSCMTADDLFASLQVVGKYGEHAGYSERFDERAALIERDDYLRQRCIDLLGDWIESEADEVKPATPAAKPSGSKPTANMLMMDEVTKNPDAAQWTAAQWADAIGRGETTVKGTEAWAMFEKSRALREAKRGRSV